MTIIPIKFGITANNNKIAHIKNTFKYEITFVVRVRV